MSQRMSACGFTPSCLPSSMVAYSARRLLSRQQARLNALFLLAFATARLSPCDALSAAELPAGEAQVRALITEAWRPPPESIDLVVFREYNRRSVDDRLERQVRRTYERIFQSLIRDPERARRWNADSKLREQELESRVSLSLAAHREVMFACCRYRLQGGLIRVDQTLFPSREEFEAQIQDGPVLQFEKTFCNAGAAVDGLQEGFNYDMGLKQAHRSFQASPAWKHDEVWRFATIGLRNMLLIRGATRASSSPTPGTSPINEESVAALASGQFSGGLQIAFEALMDSPHGPVDRFTLYTENGLAEKIAVVDSVPGDVGRIVRIERYDRNARIRQLETRADFGPEGFPRRFRTETYHADDWLQYDESHVVSVCVTCPLPSDTFEWNPPDGFTVTESSPGQEIVSRPDGTVETIRTQQDPPLNRWRAWLLWLNAALILVVLGRMLWIRRPRALR